MIPVLLLYAMTMWQQGQRVHQVCSVHLWSDGEISSGSKELTPECLDVIKKIENAEWPEPQQGQPVPATQSMTRIKPGEAGDCLHERADGTPEWKPCFDVPPVEWDADEPTGMMTVIACDPPMPSGRYSACVKPDTHKVHHIGCADKTRFHLYSEDGKGHCFNFAALGGSQR